MTPRVSVVIPTRDRPEMLRQAIDSVRAQTFKDYEIIVIVNGPANPQTPKILDIAEAMSCRIIRIAHSGIAVALNAGIAAARGEWVAFLDDDDLWDTVKLETELQCAHVAAADVVFSDIELLIGDVRIPAAVLRPPASMPPRAAMTIKNYGGGCSSTIAKRAALVAAGGFDEALFSPDWDMWMRLTWRCPPAWSKVCLVAVRHHQRNTSKQISWAYWTLRIHYKSLKALPRDLRHLRLPIIMQMSRVALKGAETYVRRKYVRPLRALVRGHTAAGQ